MRKSPDSTPRNTLPWPAAWTLPRRSGPITAMVFFGLVAVAGAAAGISLATPNSDSRAFPLMAGIPLAVGLALGPVSQLRIRNRSTRVIRNAHGALLVPYPLVLRITLWLIVGGAALFGLVLALVGALLGYPDTSSVDAIVVGVVLLVGALLILVPMAHPTARTPGVLISADGIRCCGFGYEASLPWSGVERVSGLPGDQHRIVVIAFADVTPRVTGSWQLRLNRQTRQQIDQGVIVVPGAALAVDPVLALHTLRYYHANPAARAELCTRAAVERVRAGAVG